MNIGERIQALRKARGLSQEELAAQIGVSRQAVSKWEAGQSQPDLDKVLALSDFFGVTTDYLLRSDPQTAPSIQSLSPERKNRLEPMGFMVIGSAINLIAIILYVFLELYFLLEKNVHNSLCLIPAFIGCITGTAIFVVGARSSRPAVSEADYRRAFIGFWGTNIWLLLFPIPFTLCWDIPYWLAGPQFNPAPLIPYGLAALGLSAYFVFFHGHD